MLLVCRESGHALFLFGDKRCRSKDTEWVRGMGALVISTGKSGPTQNKDIFKDIILDKIKDE